MMSNHETKHFYQVVMPRLGLTMTEGKIVEWYKQDGEDVQKGEVLFAIENEKSSLDIDAPVSGILQIQAPVDSVVPVLKPVALIHGNIIAAGHSDREIEANPLKEEVPQANLAAGTPAVHGKDRSVDIRATPRARKEALKLDVDLSTLTGTGIRGMIVLQDVLNAQSEHVEVKATPVAKRLADQTSVDLVGVSGTGARGMITRVDVELALAAQGMEPRESMIKPMSDLRDIISSRLSQSWREQPQVTLTTEADATLFVTAREQLNKELSKKELKVSFNTLLLRIAAKTLTEMPYMNVSLLPEGVVEHSKINIGLAVDTERGLMVPVLQDIDQKSIESIQKELDGLVERTLAGRNKGDDLAGGTFTITNLGMFEIDAFTPLINPPETGILGVGPYP